VLGVIRVSPRDRVRWGSGVQGCIGDLASLLDSDDLDGTPGNIWPEDRSWLVYTDYDLLGTKVSSSTHLVERLESDPELETLRLP